MKNQIIQTQDYLLIVSDKERGQIGYNYNFGLNKIDKLSLSYESYSTEWNCCKKIIAHLPINNVPILEDVPLLPELNIINYSETSKIYTENELREVLLECWNVARSDLFIGFPKTSNNKQWDVFTKIIQSIKQQIKYPKFFIGDMEYKHKSNDRWYNECGLMGFSDKRIKTKINPQNQTVLIGTYEY